MRRPARALAIAVVFVLICSAQTQIATVTSDSPFQLRGANIATGQGVPSWPVMPGDTIAAGQTPVTITFDDGSTLLLAPNSSAKLSLSGKTPVFQLETGAAHYMLTTLSSVQLAVGKNAVTAKDLSGDLQVPGSKPPATGWWTPAHTTIVIAGAGAATALGIGVVVANGKKVSCKNQNQQSNNNCQ